MLIRPEQQQDHDDIAKGTAQAFAPVKHSHQSEPAIVAALRKAGACWRNWLRDGMQETSLPGRLKEVLERGPLGNATPSYRKFCLEVRSESRM
ncbi:MAG: hypothetical protein H7Y22_07615 [Gemmatimonadaceae bacterium]|nr:hypothetical protein [Gloeobacterales cyanobacterium ES-bin-141]